MAKLPKTELMQQNVSGVCVNVGGDLRCIGIGDFNDEWTVGIESPIFQGEIINVVLKDKHSFYSENKLFHCLAIPLQI